MQENQELVILPQLQNDMVKYFKQVIPISVYHFYITGEIEEPDRYLEMINIIKTAEEYDTVFLYLNTPGGSLHTTIQIITAIMQSAACVVTAMEGEVSSAGSLIFLAGHKQIVNKHCTLMIHNYSHVPSGKGKEVSSRVKYSERYFEDLANELYSDFLTADEIENVLNDKDIWLNSSEVQSRLDARDAKRAKEIPVEQAKNLAEDLVAKKASKPKSKNHK